MKTVVRYKRVSPNAVVPAKDSPGSAGLTLFSTHGAMVKPGDRVVVDTGVALEIPQGMYGRIAGKSGLAATFGIVILAGVIDSDYRGEVRVILQNIGAKTFYIHTGYGIAQIILEKAYDVCLYEVSDQLSATVRRRSGFGVMTNQ